ncbi:MAG: ParA family protein, partial [Erysipelotrichaceae bacterium]|nr:ParA family protein [Erysipelotrichaceae bacterium]
PVQCEYYALEGITQLLRTIRLVKRLFNPELTIEGVLLTMYDKRLNICREVAEEIHEYFKGSTYNVIIPRNVKLTEAPSQSRSIFDYDLHSDGAKAYAQLVKELISRNSGKAQGE